MRIEKVSIPGKFKVSKSREIEFETFATFKTNSFINSCSTDNQEKNSTQKRLQNRVTNIICTLILPIYPKHAFLKPFSSEKDKLDVTVI